MGQVKEDITSTPSLLSLYILQKVAKVGIYPPSSIFIYAFMGEQYAWSYGPDGSSYDPGPAGIKILLEVHHRQADSTSPYMGRLKNHLLKVFPLGAEGREFLGVLILKSDQYDNLLLDRLLHAYILELQAAYTTDTETEQSRVVDECQDTLFEQRLQQKNEIKSLQLEVDEFRKKLDEERIHSLDLQSQSETEKQALQAELASVRDQRNQLLMAAAAPAASSATPHLEEEINKVKATLSATITVLEVERGNGARAKEAERAASERLTFLEDEITMVTSETNHLQASLKEKSEMIDVLISSRDKFRATVDGFPVGVFLHQKLHVISSLNSKMGSYIVPSDFLDAVGKKCYESIGLHLPCPGCPVAKAFESGDVQEEEIYFGVRGSPRHFRVLAMPVRGSEDSVDYVAEYFEDNTERVINTQRLNELYMEGERLKKQIELQEPDTFHRLVDNMVRAQKERKRIEVELLKCQGLLANLRRSYEEIKASSRKTTDLEVKAARLLNIARNLVRTKMPAHEKFKTLQRYILDYFE